MKLGILFINEIVPNRMRIRIREIYEVAFIDSNKLLLFLLREVNEITNNQALHLKYGMGGIMITFGSTTYLSYASEKEIADLIEHLTIKLLLT